MSKRTIGCRVADKWGDYPQMELGELASLIDDAVRLEEARSWRPIETLVPSDKRVLVSDGTLAAVFRASEIVRDHRNRVDGPPWYWRHLPALPKVKP